MNHLASLPASLSLTTQRLKALASCLLSLVFALMLFTQAYAQEIPPQAEIISENQQSINQAITLTTKQQVQRLQKSATPPVLQSELLADPAFLYNKPLDQLSFSDLGQLNDSHWQSMPKNQVFLPDNAHSFIKITLSNRQDILDEHFLELASNQIESAELYLFDTERQHIQQLYAASGNNHRFNNRPVNYRHIVYPITLEAKQTLTLLLKVSHHFQSKLKLTAWDETGFVHKLNHELIFFGMIYGALLMIVLYNLFVYLSLKEKNHLLFFFFGTFSGIFISIYEGHFAQFVAADLDWSKSLLFSIIAALMCFSFSFFNVYFLDIEKYSPISHKLLLFTGPLCATFLILLGLGTDHLIFSNASLLIILALYSFASWTGLRIWHKGITSAGFFALAMFVCSLGLLLEYLSKLAFVQLPSPAFSYATIGYTAMIMVFASALADKMRLLQKEKLDASIKLVKMTEEKAQSNLEIYKSKLSEVQLEKEAQSAKLQLQAKSEFLSLMSHEIRTPMNSLIGISDLLKDTELNEKQQSYVGSITNASNALLNVINDVLDFSQFETGKMELDSRLFNLEKVIDDCVNIFALSNNDQKLDLISYCAPNTPTQLKGDAEKIKQVCLNFLNLAAQNKHIHSIDFQVHPTGKETVNSIELAFVFDIKGCDLDFDFFKQWQHTNFNTTKNEIGLTLSVSQQLIELMNGVISITDKSVIHEDKINDEHTKETPEDTEETSVSSDPRNKEQHFQLEFTARLLFPHSDESLQIEDRKALLKDRRLLICHPNPRLSSTIEALAQSWGMRCTVTNNAKSAGERLLHDKKTYQLLLVDNSLLTPELQFSVRQSNTEHNYTTSVALITEQHSSVTKDEMKRRGVRSLFNLPFTTSALYQTLLSSLGIESDDDEAQDNNISILIAEDNAVNLLVIEGLLKKQGLSPVSCVNGLEAIELASKAPGFDLIFMDCEMPEKDGFAATSAIRQEQNLIEGGKRSTIIGLSAHASSESRNHAKASGMDDFLTKPINPEDIEQIINKMHQQQNN